jgi:hypothetical protein
VEGYGEGGMMRFFIRRPYEESYNFLWLHPAAVHMFKSASERGTAELLPHTQATPIKKKEIFLIYQETQVGAVAKSYMTKGFLMYE